MPPVQNSAATVKFRGGPKSTDVGVENNTVTQKPDPKPTTVVRTPSKKMVDRLGRFFFFLLIDFWKIDF